MKKVTIEVELFVPDEHANWDDVALDAIHAGIMDVAFGLTEKLEWDCAGCSRIVDWDEDD